MINGVGPRIHSNPLVGRVDVFGFQLTLELGLRPMSQTSGVRRAVSTSPYSVTERADVGLGLEDLTPRVSRILDAALTLFAERGYLATTMEDIGEVLNVRGPSLYKHVASKRALLEMIMVGTMAQLIRDHELAVASSDDIPQQLRRAMEVHVRFHLRYRRESLVGNRELACLEAPVSDQVRAMRRQYRYAFRDIIERGCESGEFSVRSTTLAAYTLLDMGMGLSLWYREGNEFSVDQLAYHYADLAMRIVGR